MRVAFGEYRLDTDTRTLEREDRRIPIQSKAFDLLAYLIERRERVVPSDELLDALWAGLHVTPAALSTAVQKARQAVGDDGGHQAVIHTEHGKGFRFVAEVTDFSAPDQARPNSAGAAQMPLIAELERRNVFRVAVAYGIVGWLLVEIASVVLPTFHAPEWVMQTFTVLVVLGFPLALVFAWAFELTPEGIKREAAVDPAESIRQLTGRKLDFAIIGLLAVAIVFLVWEQYGAETGPQQMEVASEPVRAVEPVEPGKSIAVLPFVNMSADADQEYFADGISEELLNTLAQFDDLHVVGRTSSFSFKDSDADLKEIGEALNADVILEGSVRTVGDLVRITAQLNNAKSGFHIWSEIYVRKLTDVFAIQTEIATAIADALRLTLSTEERERLVTRPTQNLEAYQAYLIGRQRLARFNTSDLAESVEYLQQAIELDPSFALAHAALADAYLWQSLLSSLPHREMLAKSRATAERAIELDAKLGYAHGILAAIHQTEGDFERAEEMYQRALNLNPNDVEILAGYGFLLRELGRPQEALPLAEAAVQLDPLSVTALMSVGYDLEALGRFDESLAQFVRVLELDLDYSGLHWIAAHYHQARGKLDEAALWGARAIARDPHSPIFNASQGTLFLDLADPDRAELWIERSLALGPEQFWPNHAMQLLGVYRGDEAAALRFGERAFEFWWVTGKFDWPMLTLLRDHEVRAGRYPEARALYAASHPELLNPEVPEVRFWNYQTAIDLALVLIETGERAQADLLLDRSSQIIQTLPRLGGEAGYGIADVQIHALRGDRLKALAVLRQAIDEGWRYLWWYYLKHDPNLESLHDEPEYRAMIEEIEADMAAQLAHVREMEQNGELAVIRPDETNPH